MAVMDSIAVDENKAVFGIDQRATKTVVGIRLLR